MFDQAVGRIQGSADPWDTAIENICKLVKEYKQVGGVVQAMVRAVAVHVLIALLFEGRVGERAYSAYAELLRDYIESLRSCSSALNCVVR